MDKYAIDCASFLKKFKAFKKEILQLIQTCWSPSQLKNNESFVELPFLRVLDQAKRPLEKDEVATTQDDLNVRMLLETAWERLHSVHYHETPDIWRTMYSLAQCIRSSYRVQSVSAQLQLAGSHEDFVLSLREAIHDLDMALIMAGATGLNEAVLVWIQELQAVTTTLRSSEERQHDQKLFDNIQRLAAEPQSPLKLPGRSSLGAKEGKQIRRIHADEFTLSELRRLAEPVIVTDALNHCRAISPGRSQWCKHLQAFFQDLMGLDRWVPVELGRAYTDDDWSQQIVTVRAFLEQIVASEVVLDTKSKCIYLAQHALARQMPMLMRDICIPDYIMMMPDPETPQLHFWIGPAATTSPLHTDPKRNWFAQMVGFKYVRLYAPEESRRIYAHDSQSMIGNTSRVTDLDDFDRHAFPDFLEAPFSETVVGPGDLLMGEDEKFTSADDLIYIEENTDAAIVKKLNDRFTKDQIYSRIGEDILVSVNPNRPLELNAEGNTKAYNISLKEGYDRDPHVFELAASTYYQMKETKLDHSMVFLGETGSGKSFAFNLALKQLVTCSKSKKKEDKTSGRLQKAIHILDAFGNARTILNNDASRYGKLVEVQFNSRHKLIGAKVSDYLLEKSRVTDVPYEERNYHVFYYLLAGASTDEKQQHQLSDPTKYSILNTPKIIRADTLQDAAQFSELKSSMKALGFKDKYQSQIFQLLSALLMLSNLVFDESGSRDEAAIVKNVDVLNAVSELLGLRAANLENALVYKTKLIKKELCTMFLDQYEAAEQRDNLVQVLYSLLWAWIVECINKRLCHELPITTISLVDMPGLENLKDNFLYQLLYNYTAEKTLAFANQAIFDLEIEEYQNQSVPFPEVSYADNSKILEIIESSPDGVLTILDEESSKTKRKTKTAAMLDRFNSAYEENSFFIHFPKKSKMNLFGIRHYGEDVHYDASDFLAMNTDHQISADFITLFRGGPDTKPSKNSFVASLFSDKAVEVERAPANRDTYVGASKENAPRRKPSVHRKKAKKETSKEKSKGSGATFSSQYQNALEELLESLGDTKLRFVYCLNSNSALSPNKFDSKKIGQQVSHFGIKDIALLKSKGFGLRLTNDVFIDRYRLIAPEDVDRARSGHDKVDAICRAISTTDKDLIFGSTKAFLSEGATRALNMKLQEAKRAEKKRLKEKLNRRSSQDKLNVAMSGSKFSDVGSDYTEGSDYGEEEQSEAGTEYSDDQGSYFDSEYGYESEVGAVGSEAMEKAKAAKEDMVIEEEEEPISPVRRNWLIVTTLLTWWIPGKCLEWNGMKRADIRQAWREKVAICILIFLLCALMLFFIAGFSLILCPRDDMYDAGEISGHGDPLTDMWVVVRGNIFDYTTRRLSHPASPQLVDEYAGKDATAVFLIDATTCGLEEDGDPHTSSFNSSWVHPSDVSVRMSKQIFKREWKGFLAWKKDEIKLNHSKAESYFIIVNNRVYDMTFYRYYNQRYYGDDVTLIVRQFGGDDASAAFKDARGGKRALQCMDQIQFVGVVDGRETAQCRFANILLLAATGMLVAIMLVKFISALQCSSAGEPEDYDRFVICQVPCYTEGEESLKRTIDSLASLKYDDKRKLLFIISDGNIIGSGNDRATWRIALDLLGVDPSIDPPKLSFQSLGEGNRQHNMGKVYTGLYDCAGHLVPYIVVVKVGKENETRRPGNRGKRDSQLVLMRFLQKVHYDEPMSPLELEIYHQIKNVIGVDPSFYEFILMVDADTEVMPDSLNRLVSSMVHDAKVVGICGETALANEKDSIITMMQVYEYYISHHLSKAFESLFGSVTCLPGCFCMYRIRTPNKSIPLLTAKPVVMDYSVNNVDTLHKKNLLSLGEDRYLTTLMLKHFPNMKIKFTPDAMCKTYAPDRWSILLSQRRRWINSTVHNLLELLMLPQLCGFCCFSMRFVVFFDLFATLVMPAATGYLAYLIYGAIAKKNFPLVSLILLVAGYGLQVIIFLIKRQWQHIGWIVIYLLALPVYTLIIPIYAFWHFDDFSWGTTRVVVGEKGGKKHIIDEEPFDPNSIPMKRWTEYEQQMWENESNVSGKTGTAYSSYAPSHATSYVSGSAGYPISYVAPVGVPPMYSDPSVNGSRRTSLAKPLMSPTLGGPEPSDDQLVSQIKSILATANLMTVTKKQVRDELTAFFGVDMTPRKDFINKVIEDVLQGRT